MADDPERVAKVIGEVVPKSRAICCLNRGHRTGESRNGGQTKGPRLAPGAGILPPKDAQYFVTTAGDMAVQSR
jgi:hypothetical protein